MQMFLIIKSKITFPRRVQGRLLQITREIIINGLLFQRSHVYWYFVGWFCLLNSRLLTFIYDIKNVHYYQMNEAYIHSLYVLRTDRVHKKKVADKAKKYVPADLCIKLCVKLSNRKIKNGTALTRPHFIICQVASPTHNFIQIVRHFF